MSDKFLFHLMKNPWVVHKLFVFVCCSYLFICSCIAFIGCISHVGWFLFLFFLCFGGVGVLVGFLFWLTLLEPGCTFMLHAEQLEVCVEQLFTVSALAEYISSILCMYIFLLGSSLPYLVSSWLAGYSLNSLLLPSGCSALCLCGLVNEVLLWFWGSLPCLFVFLF